MWVDSSTKILTDDIVFMEQIHSAEVGVLTEKALSDMKKEGNLTFWGVDALLTDIKGVYLCVRTADCYPVLLFDKVREVVAVVHSGREGTRQKIVQKVIMTMKEVYKSDPADIKMSVGVGICSEHYEVSPEVAEDFGNVFGEYTFSRKLDLAGAIRSTALLSGIKEANIEQKSGCTYEDEQHYSYRRDRTNRRQISITGMVYGRDI
ncbi:MAG: polyphenol oxidase family protein [Candidatus Cloacimonetes bacterium]|nr:polyphenol oxidase family protein [Candidatus Cloacimonadota bacterium]